MGEACFFMREYIVSHNRVDAILIPILHVVTKHLNHLVEIKLPSSTELQQEGISMPRVVRDFVLFNPLFKELETLFLFW